MSLEIKETIEQIGRSFEQFKEANDQRLKEIEKKGKADPLLEEKTDKISESLNVLCQKQKQLEDDIAKLLERSARSSDRGESRKKDVSEAINLWGHSGDTSKLVEKSLVTTVGADGGFVAPGETSTTIFSLLQPLSPIRSLVNVKTISSSYWEQPVSVGGTDSGWTEETQSRSETNTSEFKMLRIEPKEAYAKPKASQTMIDDSAIDIEGWLNEEIAIAFAKDEATAFTSGNGVARPKGILSYTAVATADSARAYGEVEYVPTGVSGNFANSDKADILLDLLGKFKNGMLQGAAWGMRGSTITAIRKLKDGNSNYLWTPGITEGGSQTLHSYPVVQIDDIPAIAANSLSIVLANWKRAYTIVDRIGIRLIRDILTAKPFIEFYSTRRVGGGIVDSEAIKFIKFSAS